MLRQTTPLVFASALALAGCSLGTSGWLPGGSSDEPSGQASTSAPIATTTRSEAPTNTRRSAPRARLADLMGADAARLDGFLGKPEIVRQEGPAQLRLYRSTTCVLHVFLYPADGRVTATHIEGRNETARLEERQLNTCVASFS